MINCIKRYYSENVIALIYEERRISYRELFDLIAYNQMILNDNGINSKDIVAFRVENQLEFVIIFLSLVANGSNILPISSSVSRAEEEDVIELTKCKMLDFSLKRKLVDLENKYKKSLMGCFKNKEEESFLVHMTSGSSGKAKLCLRKISKIIFEGMSYNYTFGLKAPYNIMSLCPLEHSFSLGAALAHALVNGCTLHIFGDFKPRRCLNYLRNHDINFMTLIPDMADVLCKIDDGKNDSKEIMRGMRICLTATASIKKETYDNFYEKFNVRLLSNYGSTETGGVICRTDPNDYKQLGKAMWNVKIKVCDEEGEKISNGIEGLLYVKSPGMFSGYLYGETEFDEEGYFTLYDRVIMNEKEEVFFVERSQEITKINGMKVSFKQIENAILGISGVVECKVVKVDNILIAYVVQSENKEINYYTELKGKIYISAIPKKFIKVNHIKRDKLGKIRVYGSEEE